MCDGFCTYIRVAITHTPKLISLVLEEVGIDRSKGYSVLCGEVGNRCPISTGWREIPWNMERNGGCCAGQPMNAAGILDFFKDIPRSARLWKCAKACACICKTPARELNR